MDWHARAASGDTRSALLQPHQVLLSHELSEPELMGEALSARAGRKVNILVPQRGEKKDLVQHARNNAREALGRQLAEGATQKTLLEGVANLFGLDEPPRRQLLPHRQRVVAGDEQHRPAAVVAGQAAVLGGQP